MAIDVEATFARGGKELVGLLEYCVMAVAIEPLFAFLIREYRLRPSAQSALVLFDMFCGASAPARLPLWQALPPRVLGLQHAVEAIRAAVQQRDTWQAEQQPVTTGAVGPAGASTSLGEDEMPPVVPIPGKFLFDRLDHEVWACPRMHELRDSYNPELTPAENLPGGQMNASQRAFVDQRWLPVIRPRLVMAGFWRVSSIG